MTVKKPDFGNPPDPRLLAEAVQIIIGRGRAGATTPVPPLRAGAVGAAPTADDFNALVADVADIRSALNDLLARIQDG